ncbi:GTP 3',8-cyclase MoaA [Aquabacterium sp. CECT 9606]|uniref:GTP 3',8-cyclase MoaA n=1 Tax=Aquabacterium sp. CECT 9606 TaxID=2845822 RepID=UPI001E5054E4|nr:GTP 3',8-cyclase MoaA [Aquabacterium sp. CECT 9606]
MSESTLVPLQRLREQLRSPRTSPILPLTGPRAAHGEPIDRLGRPLRDLRISVTDRCNFRCGYCMPRDVFGSDHPFLPQPQLLSFEEITRTARIFLGLGVRKLRLTGGEPLLRRHLERLVEQLAQLRTLDGQPPELTLTTNGSILARKAQALKNAGLHRITVSLDALDDAVFKRMNDADFPVGDVLSGIEAAQAAGLGPIKVNMVVQRGVNDDQILPMARHFRGTGIELRFIEFMDVGNTNAWQMDQVLPSSQVRQRIQAEFPLQPATSPRPGETAQRWSYADGQGSVGFISSVTQAFCGDCNRLRLSTDGQLFTCLFASRGHDLRTLLRADRAHSDSDIAAGLRQLWAQREDQYSQLRAQGVAPEQRIEMSYIGG